MLEERANSRKRVSSARSTVSKTGSARQVSCRVGPTRHVSGRVGSARPSSDSRRPKLHTGRPSSAPPGRVSPHVHVPTRPAPATSSGFVKTHNVGHLSLKVEGKSIRSVAYSSTHRPQPVSRGSVRVVSSHIHAVPPNLTQILPGHKIIPSYDVGSDSERSSLMGFGTTYTLPLSPDHSIVYGNSDLCNKNFMFGSTYTQDEQTHDEHRLGETYTLRAGADNYHFSDRLARVPPDGKAARVDPGYSVITPFSSSLAKSSDKQAFLTDRSQDSFTYGDSAYNLRPQSLKKSTEDKSSCISPTRSTSQADFVKRDTDSASNDGSESTVMSLGQKIQIMASSPEHKNPEENWDSEWKQLLKQNHELLLKLSSREDLRSPECIADSSRNIEMHDSGVQTLTYTREEEREKELNNVKDTLNCPDDVLSDSDHIEEIQEVNTGDEDTGSFRETFMGAKSPECVLEDIIEESSSSSKSSPRVVVNYSDTDRKDDPSDKIEIKTDEQPRSLSPNTVSPLSENSDFENISIRASKLLSVQQNPPDPETKLVTSDAITKSADISLSDFSCTADLPVYRSGSAMTCVVLNSSRIAKDRHTRTQPSKDLLDALKMIEDDENCTVEEQRQIEELMKYETVVQGTNESKLTATSSLSKESKEPASTSRPFVSSSYTGSTKLALSSSPPVGQSLLKPASSSVQCAPPPPATLPVLQVLVEKVFLFTQDLAERWKLGGDGDEQHEELLRQVVEAERLLEIICVGEGRKRDPNTPPEELHAKCREEVARSQRECEARIQRNLELIRKLMDDKRALTERCEELLYASRTLEKKHGDKLKLVEQRHSQELQSLKERTLASEQEKREKWTRQKTRMIKETTYRGLETKMKDLSAKHRDEISQLKAQHWEEKRQAEEKYMSQLRAQEEELKKKCEEEKEEACRREQEREQQRLEMEIRQSEQHSLSRLESVRKQHEHDLRQLVEEHTRELNRWRAEAEAARKDAAREKERQKEDQENKISQLIKSHQEEIAELHRKEERAREEWKEQLRREGEEARQRAERELRERLKRQRDREIDRAIREVQREAEAREKETLATCNGKIKNLRDKYESELSELETSEQGARERYLEMRSVLARKEEEIVYLRARLHTQDLELTELQHMFRPPDD